MNAIASYYVIDVIKSAFYIKNAIVTSRIPDIKNSKLIELLI